ncbi:MAG TPA: hypothetical protein VFI32_06805 [Rhodanobacteraceae bacterium]|nr:hypothetical protein [Rhodanobacteraceae bacterium]
MNQRSGSIELDGRLRDGNVQRGAVPGPGKGGIEFRNRRFRVARGLHQFGLEDAQRQQRGNGLQRCVNLRGDGGKVAGAHPQRLREIHMGFQVIRTQAYRRAKFLFGFFEVSPAEEGTRQNEMRLCSIGPVLDGLAYDFLGGSMLPVVSERRRKSDLRRAIARSGRDGLPERLNGAGMVGHRQQRMGAQQQQGGGGLYGTNEIVGQLVGFAGTMLCQQYLGQIHYCGCVPRIDRKRLTQGRFGFRQTPLREEHFSQQGER